MTHLEQALQRLRDGVAAADLESDTLEFKQEAANIKQTLALLADAVVCFANARGGTIVLGVADRPVANNSIVGTSPALTPQSVVRGIFDRTRPPLSVPVDVVREGDARLLSITVPAGAVLYATAGGTATRRVGAECQPFSPEQQRQALAARGMRDWTEGDAGAEMHDIDTAEVARIRRLLLAAGHEDLAGSDDAALLRGLRLLGPDGRPTRAAVILAGHEASLERLVPTYGYTYLYRPTSGSEATTRVRGRRPLVSAIDLLIGLVSSRRSLHPLNLAGGVQMALEDYPDVATRELVVNALVHRDYEFAGSVEIEHTPERLSIHSPGGLVFGVTPENILRHPSTPRNELLFESVTALNIAERAGQGVDRAYRQLLRIGKRPPVFEDDHTRVTVHVAGGRGDDSFVRFVNTRLDDTTGRDLEVLLALSSLRDRRTIDASILSTGIQLSIGQAQAALERMMQSGLVEPTKRTARSTHPRYALSAEALADLGRAVSYHRGSTDGTDQKVIEHVQEYGDISNATLRRMLDLNVYAARDLLRDLQARQILVKIGEQRSGPGVRYGAGRAFPDSGATQS